MRWLRSVSIGCTRTRTRYVRGQDCNNHNHHKHTSVATCAEHTRWVRRRERPASQERRLRQWHRHEQMTVAMVLAESAHHGAPRGQKMARTRWRSSSSSRPERRKEEEEEEEEEEASEGLFIPLPSHPEVWAPRGLVWQFLFGV